VDVGGVSSIQDVALSEKKIYFLGTGSDGLGIYTNGKLVSKPISLEDGPTLLRLFGTSAYVYVKDAGDIRKLAGNGDTFSDATGWIKSSQGLDRKTITSMTIDGKIWVTTNNGGIFAFAQGTKQSFTVTGMLQPFNGPLMIYTSPDLPFLYVLEPSQQRLVILNKDGVYQKQIISKDLGVTTDLVVTEDGKTAYLLAGSSVYSVGLE
jgi:hypothetical protein